ncbi:hypothetical protein JXI42_02910 [bacterium]|nr:hypothetical protein [bacterium]
MTCRSILFIFIYSISFIILQSLIVNHYSISCASVPRIIHYQAGLHDDSGAPLAGSHTITSSLYTWEVGGTPIWTEIHTVEIDSFGLYEVMLGSLTSFESADVDFEEGYYLGISVDGGEEIGRHQIGSAPYSFHAAYADNIAGISNIVKSINDVEPDSSGDIKIVEGAYINISEIPDSNIIRISAEDIPSVPNPLVVGDVEPGIVQVMNGTGVAAVELNGTPGVDYKLKAITSGSETAHGVVGITESTGDSSAGIFGKATVDERLNYGVKGITNSYDPDAAGVYGVNTSATAPFPVGVMGQVYSESSIIFDAMPRGVFGEAKGPLGTGVMGISRGSEEGSYGVWGISQNRIGVKGETYSGDPASAGILGLADTGKAVGVYGKTASNSGSATAIKGGASADIGETIGIHGILKSCCGTGVLGVGFCGVLGEANEEGEFGVMSSGTFLVGGGSPFYTTFTVEPATKSINIYNDGMLLTRFGTSERRVAIQKVNNTATPTLGDNNFIISAEAPLLIANGDHGITISCPDCCEEPCGGGGSTVCDCESLITTGGGGRNGKVVIYNDDGTEAVSMSGSVLSEFKLGGFGKHGSLEVFDASGDWLSKMRELGAAYFVPMTIYNDFNVTGTKSFIAPHPEHEGMDIKFYCAEPPEVMIEYRGSIELTEGYGERVLPHEFKLVA